MCRANTKRHKFGYRGIVGAWFTVAQDLCDYRLSETSNKNMQVELQLEHATSDMRCPPPKLKVSIKE